MEQQVFHINTEIYDAIVSVLQNSTQEILVASAWFTDETLFNILKRKIGEGIRVEVIVADNENNAVLPFEQLVNAGGIVLKVKNVGYGMMHQKFCVVDKKEVVFGSYNWTVNARKNNHESIIRSSDLKTVDKFVEIFHDIKEKANQIEGKSPGLWDSIKGKFFGRNGKGDMPEISKNGNHSQKEEQPKPSDFASILDAMIASEISGYDRELLFEQGHNMAKSNNGNHEILPKSLDSLYSSFINDIHVVEDKKKRLLAKIQEQQIKRKNQIDADHQIEISLIKFENHSMTQVLETEVTSLETEKEKIKLEIDTLESNRIKPIQDKIQVEEAKIDEANRAFAMPTMNWGALIFLSLGVLVLAGYIFLFYSSAAYILLYSTLDAEIAKLNGITLNPPEVFNHEALANAKNRGNMALLMILVFPIVPLTLAMGKKIASSRLWGQVISLFLGLLVVDSFVAYKVAAAIHEANYLSGKVDTIWEWNMVLGDSNFYLVFVMGAFGILLFKVLFEKLVGIFEDRSPDIDARRKQGTTKKMKSKIDQLNKSILAIKDEIAEKKGRDKEIDGDLVIKRSKLVALPSELNSGIERLNLVKNAKENEVDRISDLYTSHVENDNLPISVDAIKDRISVFLNGWNRYLHEEYSIIKAIEMSSRAMVFSNDWLANKVSSQGRENIFSVKS